MIGHCKLQPEVGVLKGTGPSLVRQSLAASLLLVFCYTSDTAAADPFFVARLREGKLAHQRAEYAEAVRLLRIANFGFLDEPELLAEGLSRLALSQLALGQEESYLRTFTRLLDLEERFSAFSSAQLSESLRGQMAAFLLVLPRQLIEESSTFVEMAAQASDALSEGEPSHDLSRRQRRQAARSGHDPEANLALAELRLEHGKFNEAARLAEQALRLSPSSERARCLRDASLGNARLSCASVVDSLQACDKTSSDPLFIRGLIRCLLQLDRAPEARQLLEKLDPSVRQHAAVERAARSVLRKASHQSRDRPTVEPIVEGGPDLEVESSAPATAANPATPISKVVSAGERQEKPPGRGNAIPEASRDESATALDSRERSALARARRLLSTSSSISELEAALTTTHSIARQHPDQQEALLLAAQLATRAGRWVTALTHFRDAAPIDPSRVDLHFYLAVALEGAGYRQAAQSVLSRYRDRLPKVNWIHGYVDRIASPAR